MAKKRDTVTYELRDSKNRKVYIGTTNNPEKRELEHHDTGKTFSSLNVTSRNMTEEGAKKQETEKLKTYRKSHHGQNPKYNKDNDG